jgi:hypothetical protein
MKRLALALLLSGCATANTTVNDATAAIRLEVNDVPEESYCPVPAAGSNEQVCISGLRNGVERSLRHVLDEESKRFHCSPAELSAAFRLVDVHFRDGAKGQPGSVEMTYDFQLRHKTRGVLVERVETLSESYRGATSARGREAFLRLVRVVIARVSGAINQAAVDG